MKIGVGTWLDVDDTIYYVSLTNKYCITKSKVKERKSTIRRGLYGVEYVMENGDVLGDYYDVFRTKQETVAHLIESITSEIGYERIRLASTQQHIEELERKLQALQNWTETKDESEQ